MFNHDNAPLVTCNLLLEKWCCVSHASLTCHHLMVKTKGSFFTVRCDNFVLLFWPGRPTTLQNDVLMEVEANPCQTIEKHQPLFTTLGRPSKQQIGKVNMCHLICPKKIKLTDPPPTGYCFSSKYRAGFWSLETKYQSFMMIQNTNGKCSL